VNYTFSVVALNAVGVSPPLVTVTPVTPCTLNTATAPPTPQLRLNLNASILETTIATTTGATGIGTATDLPTGITATWSNNSIKISGTPTAANTFNYSIPLTGGCGSVNATGTVTVTECLTPTSGAINLPQTITQYLPIDIISIVTVNVERINVISIPDGLTATLGNGGIVTISGTPTVFGIEKNIIIQLIGCPGTSAAINFQIVILQGA
jgi:hypothetical protein